MRNLRNLFIAITVFLVPSFLHATSGGSVFSPFQAPHGSTTTARCNQRADVGKVFIDTDQATGQMLFVCEGAAGWVQYGAGGATLHSNLSLDGAWGTGTDAISMYNTSAYNALNRVILHATGKSSLGAQEDWDSIYLGKDHLELWVPEFTTNNPMVDVDSISHGVDPTIWFGKHTSSNFSFCFGDQAVTDTRGGQCFDFRDSTQKEFRFWQYMHFYETLTEEEGIITSTLTVTAGVAFTFTYKAAVCQGSNSSLGFSGFAASTPTAACVSNSSATFGVAQFTDNGSTQSVQDHFQLPSDWTGAIDASIVWRSTATSNNIVWQLRTSCVGDGGSAPITWNPTSIVTDAAKGSALQFNTAAITGVSTTNCSAGEELFFDFFRNPAHASDTLASAGELISVMFKIRRTLQ